MTRRVIIDCDPGIDDSIALCLALFDPRLEVVAVTATAGNVDAHQSSRNVQTIIEMLDPPRWPRMGMARSDEDVSLAIARELPGGFIEAFSFCGVVNNRKVVGCRPVNTHV